MIQVAKEAIEKCTRKIQIVLLDKCKADAINYKDVIQNGDIGWPKEVLESGRNNDDVCLLPYSSGTTGLPKGVMLTAQNPRSINL